MKSYPMKFKPILKEKIWGGSKLITELNKSAKSNSIGESWEISGVDENISEVANGTYAGTTLNYLINLYTTDFLGRENYARFGKNFPLLIKFLDANSNLSVQVHPDDEMAALEHKSFGKTEMWYVMDHDKDAEIILGLQKDGTSIKKLKELNQDNVYSLLNSEKVSRGDSFFIPAGKVHAIGQGVMVAEIQQSSDITYRLYDWDRTDKNGIKRTLHTTQAIKATKDFQDASKSNYSLQENGAAELVNCEYFRTNIIDVQKIHQRDYSQLDSFVIFICVEGTACVEVNGHSERVQRGETLLIPANTDKVHFDASDAKFLEVSIPTISKETFANAS